LEVGLASVKVGRDGFLVRGVRLRRAGAFSIWADLEATPEGVKIASNTYFYRPKSFWLCARLASMEWKRLK
jgi:hypothetical protein